MFNIVEIKDLTKSFGSKKALDSLNLDIEMGKVVGVLGPNGSGKTTLIKTLTGLLRPTSGTVLIKSNPPGIETKKVVSYLPDRNPLYDWMSVESAGKFYKDFYDDFSIEKFQSLVEELDLPYNEKVKKLSKGMKEKLILALVLSREAEIYILDEPIAGVDPVARDQILGAIINNYRKESAMLITTHLVRDMENLFDDVVFLKAGKVELQGDAEQLREEKSLTIDALYKEIFS